MSRQKNDLISRQAALDVIEEIRWRIWDVDIPSPTVPEYIEHHKQMKELMDRCDKLRSNLVNLPSAQPEIIRCKDCKHKHLENMVWTCPFGLPGGENFFCGYGAEPYKGEQE